jgi:hypothetical protein
MGRMGGALLRLCSPGALAMPAGVKQATPRARLRAGNVQFQGPGDCAGAFASGKTPRPSFTGNVILAGKWLERAEQDIEPGAGFAAENLIGSNAKQKRSVESDAPIPDNLTREPFAVDRQIRKTPKSNWINADHLVRRSTQLA